MASFTADTKAAWAAASSSGPAGTPRNTKTGTPAVDEKWSRVCGQIARTYIADPDCFFYQAYLGSNRQYGLALELRSLLTELIQYAEGARYPSAPAPTLVELPPHLVGASAVEGIDEISGILAQRAKAAASASKVGRRLTEKGDEAKKLYNARVSAFVQKYFTFQTALSSIADASPDFAPLRQIALVDVQTSADAALNADYKPENAAAYAVQAASAAAALRTTNRVPKLESRLSYKQQFFPESVVVSVGGTTITFKTQSPAYCYLRVGDVFTWAGGATSLSAVTDTSATLAANVGTPSSYEIVPGPLASFRLLQEQCASFLNTQDVADRQFLYRISDISSMQTAAEVIAFLASVQNALTGMTPEVLDVLQRLGLPDPASVTPISTSLRAYSPSLPSNTKSAAKACLSTLEREGFQLAAQRFLSADLTFLSETANAQQLSGLFDATVGNAV